MCKKKELNIRLMENKNIDPFAQYYISGEPNKAQKAYAWKTAIGLQNGIHETTVFLEKFLRNLLLGEDNELKNRYLHIDWQDKTTHLLSKQDIKQDIDEKNRILALLETVQCAAKTKKNIICLYDTFGKERIFGRTEVINVLTITPSPASALIKKMLELGPIENVRGLGKGKYRFVRC